MKIRPATVEDAPAIVRVHRYSWLETWLFSDRMAICRQKFGDFELMIRKALPDDAEAIARVHVESWHETYKNLVPQAVLETRINYERRLKMWNQMLADDSLITLVALEGAKILGFVNGGKARDAIEGYDGELYALYLLKDHQGKGLGRQLVEDFAKEMQEHNYQAFYLWVLHNNEQAQRFYEHLGGKRVSEKNFETEVGPIVEIAYGWPDLETLNS